MAVGSEAHRTHVLVACPAGRAFRCRLVDPFQVLARQGDPERYHVLLQIFAALGAGDRNDALPLGQEPRQGQLGWRHVFRGGDLLHSIHELQVLLEVLSLEPRPLATPVVRWQILEAAQLAGEEAAAKRAVRDEADAQFPDGREQLVLRDAAPQRILGLQGGNRVYRVRPADGRGHRLGQAEVTHLPLPYQFRHGTDGLFNGDVRIDTVLVVEVDVVDPQPSERAVAGLAHMFRAA